MATVPSQQTFTAGSTLTAAQLNDDVRDAINFLLDPPSAYAYHSTTQTVSTGISSFTLLAMDSESWDNDGIHSTSTNNSRMTIQTDGTYFCKGIVTFQADTNNNNRNARLTKNGSGGTVVGVTKLRNANANTTSMEVTSVLPLVAGDYIELWASQDTGGNLNTNGGQFVCSISVRWVAL